MVKYISQRTEPEYLFILLSECLSDTPYMWRKSKDINESTNFHFLQRLSSYLASAEPVRNLLLPAETVVLGK